MRKSTVLQHLRKNQLKKLIFPLILLLLCINISGKLSVLPRLFPEKIQDESEALKRKDAEDSYLTITPDTLYYTGYDVYRNAAAKGSYYYRLTENHCYFYLIETPDDASAEPVINGRSFRVKVVKKPKLQTDLVRFMAKDLNWTEEGLLAITSPYFFSSVEYISSPEIPVLLLLTLGFIVSMAGLLQGLFLILFPHLALAVSRLKKYDSERQPLLALEKELSEDPLVICGTLYLTKHYFIALEDIRTIVLPIASLVWIYRHTTLYRFLGHRFSPRYHLVLMTHDGKLYECPNHTKEETDQIIRGIRDISPDILIGYNAKNREKAYKKNKSARHE